MELDADVIGIGTMGSQALWQLAARGLKALGIEQFEPGHGYKFAPLIGEIAADLVTEGRASHPIELFRPARFAAHEIESVAGPA